MNRSLAAGLAVVGGLALIAVAAPGLTALGLLADPGASAIHRTHSPPGASHPMGTDQMGRDVLSRVAHGARPSMTVALLATLVALGLGIPAGALAGLRGGAWDLVLTRLMELTVSLPSLPLILLVLSLSLRADGTLGPNALPLLAATIGVTRWAGIARYVRGGIWKVQVEDYVAGSLALGSGRGRVLFRHMLPAALAPALVSAAFGAGSAVLLESALRFLGLGTRAPDPSWGHMIARAAEAPDAWWQVVFPGLSIALLVMGFNLVAEGIRKRTGVPGTEWDGQVGGRGGKVAALRTG